MILNNLTNDLNCPVCKEHNLHVVSCHAANSNYVDSVMAKIKFYCEHGCDVPDYFIYTKKGSTYTQWVAGIFEV